MAAATACAAVWLLLVTPQAAHNASTLRMKGESYVDTIVSRDGRAFAPTPQVPVQAGDVVMLRVRTPVSLYVSVIAVEGEGHTVHYANQHVAAGDSALPDTLVLDAATSNEQWHVLATPDPHDTASLVAQFLEGDDTHVIAHIELPRGGPSP